MKSKGATIKMKTEHAQYIPVVLNRMLCKMALTGLNPEVIWD